MSGASVSSASSANGNTLLPLFDITGDTPFEIGYNYGSHSELKPRIKRCFNVYLNWFLSMGITTESQIRDDVKQYTQIIGDQCPKIMQEIEGIAQGSNLALWKVLMINCRTEILNTMMHNNTSTNTNANASTNTTTNASTDDADVNLNARNNGGSDECSGIICRRSHVLAQNWDWRIEMQELAILVRINDDILMMTEPGMVGKIGFNKHGVGCTLMLLSKVTQYQYFQEVSSHATNANAHAIGIPIHIIMRLVLECKSNLEIQQMLRRLTVNTFSCLGIMCTHTNTHTNTNNHNHKQKHNIGYFLEFCGYQKYEMILASRIHSSCHTNHYQGCGLGKIAADVAGTSSWLREQQMLTLFAQQQQCLAKNAEDNDESDDNANANANDDIENIKRILTNHSLNTEFPICRPFVRSGESSIWGQLYTGTVCTIIMDLSENAPRMIISRGSPLKYPFETIYLNNKSESSSDDQMTTSKL